MKKLITICLLVLTILIGGMTMDAKTTKKKTKARTTQTSAVSFTPKSFMKSTGRGYELKSLKQIKAILTHNGYKYVRTEETNVWGLDANLYIYRNSKGNIVQALAISDRGVVDDVYEITFIFINKTEKDKFYKENDSVQIGAHDQVVTKVEGNTVIMSDDCYYC